MIQPALNRLKQKGFTLIELMVVIAVIGIFAGTAIPQFAKYSEAKQAAHVTEMQKMNSPTTTTLQAR